METTTNLATEVRHLADAAADLHRRLDVDGPADASAAWLALDRFATVLDQEDDAR